MFANADSLVGTCDDGTCLYSNVTQGVFCDDGNPRTGPDLCTGRGECVGQTACVVSTQTGVEDDTFGGSLQSQANMDTMLGCITVDGHLFIDCVDPITDLAALGTVTKITGALIIENCQATDFDSLGMAFASLNQIAGIIWAEWCRILPRPLVLKSTVVPCLAHWSLNLPLYPASPTGL